MTNHNNAHRIFLGRKCWPEDCKAPYLVLVDDGMAIYCRRTDKDFIKRSDVPPMEVIHSE